MIKWDEDDRYSNGDDRSHNRDDIRGQAHLEEELGHRDHNHGGGFAPVNTKHALLLR